MERSINERISYVEASHDPLSADIGIIRDGESTWLFDVGNGDASISTLNDSYNVVLSHFHPDHIGNISKVKIDNLYVSNETFTHLPKDMRNESFIHIVTEPIVIGSLTILPIPSSHAKGSLALSVDDTYTFLGDALYCKQSKNGYVYNAQLLYNEIELLKTLKSPYFLSSHFPGLVRQKEEVLEELEEIYSRRTKESPEIPIS